MEVTSLLDINERIMKKLATSATLARGLAFFTEGKVINSIVFGQTLRGEVIGSGLSNYIASVEIKNKRLNASCNCPSKEPLCRHSAALLYAWLKSKEKFKEITKIEASLGRKKKEELIDLLLKMIKKEPSLISTLNLDIPEKVSENRRYGEQAILPLEFEIQSYQQLCNLLTKLKEIRNTTKNYEPQMRLKILQSIIYQSIHNYKKTYDIDGLFAEFIEECLDDCLKFTIPQKQLFFNDFIELYLSDKGGFATSILELVIKQCQTQDDYVTLERILLTKLSELKQDNLKEDIIEFLLELYNKKGDNDRYLEVCMNNLDNWKNCIRLCDKLQQSGKINEAIQWYQKAIDKYEKYPRIILKKKLVSLYEKANMRDEALNLHFDIFKEQDDLESYKKMKALFGELKQWQEIRNNLLLFLGKAKKYPLLIEILLYENEIDSAIKIALLPNQRVTDIKNVAQQAMTKKPTQAIRLFKRLISYYIGLRRKDDYKIAKEYCQQVKKIYQELNQEHTWQKYMKRIKRLNVSNKLLLEELEEI
ncbi:MAG: SWIM zinc finger family protein [bacterium]